MEAMTEIFKYTMFRGDEEGEALYTELFNQCFKSLRQFECIKVMSDEVIADNLKNEMASCYRSFSPSPMYDEQRLQFFLTKVLDITLQKLKVDLKCGYWLKEQMPEENIDPQYGLRWLDDYYNRRHFISKYGKIIPPPEGRLTLH